MDSFEQFGELMNQWDSASPPGDRHHRRTFDKSLMGMEMRGGGGGDNSARDDAQEAQFWTHHYNKQLYAHQNEMGERNVAFAQDTVALQRANQEAQLSFQDRGREADYLRNNKILGMQNTASQNAYNKSERIFGEQLKLNNLAAESASSRLNLKRYEHRIKLKEDKIKTNLAAYGAKHELDSFRQKSAFQGQSDFVEGLQSIGEGALNTGRSAAKKKISALAAVDRTRVDLAHQVADAGSKFNLDLLGFATDRLFHAQTELSIDRRYDSDLELIKAQLLQANLQADMRRLAKPMMMPLQQKPELLPRQEFQDPQPWVAGPAPIKGAAYQGGGSGGGGGGGGVGGALGVASSAFGALGALGSMAATGGGAIGLGGMGTIGLGAMGPIGLGIGAVALAGEVFDWW